jgi:hypothetical protein
MRLGWSVQKNTNNYPADGPRSFPLTGKFGPSGPEMSSALDLVIGPVREGAIATDE